MLVVHGDKDRLVPLAIARGIAEKHRAPLVVIPGQGHWLIAPSLTGDVAGRVLAWIEEEGGRQGRSRRRRPQPE